MITLTYLITMGILCLVSWGISGYIWYSYKKWEREQYLKLYDKHSLGQKKLDYQSKKIYRGEIEKKCDSFLEDISKYRIFC